MTNLNANVNDLELEYQDVVKDPNDPGMKAIEAEVPEKYKGKTVDEMIDMHINLEKVLARQGNEVGQLRKVVDTQASLLNHVTAPKQTEPKKPEVNAERLLDDPVGAVNSVVEANPEIQRMKAEQAQQRVQMAQDKFENQHPTYKDDVNNPDFQSWVLGSQLRSNLLVGLHNYNFQAGDQLWELWNEHSTAKNAAETARQGRVNAATVTRVGPGEAAPKKFLSRAKLADLQLRVMRGDAAAKAQWEDPTFQNEYQAAYAEGRVK